MFLRFYKQINSNSTLKIRCMWSQSKYIKQSKWKPHLNCLKILHFWKKLWFQFFNNVKKNCRYKLLQTTWKLRFRGYKLSRTTEKFAKSWKFPPAKLSTFKVQNSGMITTWSIDVVYTNTRKMWLWRLITHHTTISDFDVTSYLLLIFTINIYLRVR